MQLYALSNLMDTWAGSHLDPQNRWGSEVYFLTPDGTEHEILSLGWDSGRERWVLCAVFADGVFGDEHD